MFYGRLTENSQTKRHVKRKKKNRYGKRVNEMVGGPVLNSQSTYVRNSAKEKGGSEVGANMFGKNRGGTSGRGGL